MSTDVQLVNQTPQNPFIQGVSDAAGAVGSLVSSIGGAYSSFLSAKTAATLAKNQSASYPLQPTSQQVLSAEKRTNFLVYAGVGVAILGTMALIYKAVK